MLTLFTVKCSLEGVLVLSVEYVPLFVFNTVSYCRWKVLMHQGIFS